MKVAAVLLRWYKSFNTNYMGYTDRRAGVSPRPWNLLSRNTESESDFPFIEIPVEPDITTIVGANESGKSHLLCAISKVITGNGTPDGFGDGREFHARTSAIIHLHVTRMRRTGPTSDYSLMDCQSPICKRLGTPLAMRQ